MMATIAEIRQQYPDYDDLSDQELARGLWKNNYSDMPFEEFSAKIGLNQTNTYKGLEVVQRTPDGGMVLANPADGKMMFLNEQAGYSTTDPEKISAIMEGANPAEQSQRSMQEDIATKNIGVARAHQFAKGYPFVGTRLDRPIEMIDPSKYAELQATSSAMEESRPVETAAFRTAGGIAGSIPLAMAAPAMPAIQGLPIAQRTAAYTGIGAGTGLLEGAISGSGEGKTREGAIGGLIGGAAGGLAAPLVGQGIEAIAQLTKRTDIPNIAKVLGVSPEAAMVIKTTFSEMGGDLKTALRNIKLAGDRGMIADADTATMVLLDAAGAAGGKASTIVGQNVRQRAKQESADLASYLDESLAPLPRTADGQAADVMDMATDLAKSTAGARSDAYGKAYSTPIDYSADTGRTVENTLAKIPDRFLSKAIQTANESMQMEGKRNLQILADIADDGTITFKEMPNVQQLDEIKKALGEVAFGQVDNLGRPTADAIRAARLYRELRDSIADAVPSYRDAVNIASDKISLENALDVGEKMLTNRMSVRDVSRSLAGSTESERNMAKLGARSYISEVTDRVRASVTSPDVDINALRKVLGELSSEGSKKKLSVLLGVKETQTLYKNLERANAALALRAAVAANSKTAVRQRVQQQVDQLTDTGVLQTLLQGRPAAATQKGIQAVTGATEEYGVETQKKVFTDIAKALSGIQGREAREAVYLINKAIKNQEQLDSATYGRIMNILLDNITPAGILGGAQYGSMTQE